jgi:2-polyprenyl-6-methoxyphenol hydroxylase-like FAD-dependent oxidoreductase
VRTLIIGAGLAGLTLAGRLCQQGRAPVLVERSASPEGGYAIGLYPLGSCVLHGLGTYELLRERALDPSVAREWWGTGCVFGIYPAPGRVMCGGGGPAPAVLITASAYRSRVSPGPGAAIADRMAAANSPCRCSCV